MTAYWRALFICFPLTVNSGCGGEILGACVKAESEAWTAPKLVSIGNDALRQGLQPNDWYLENAAVCYARAQHLHPDDYSANLGLGVVYLTMAKSRFGDERQSFISRAKRYLGQAYFLTQGAYDPVYYLAEVAAIEKQYDTALRFLTVLQAANAKPGPVNVLLGYISEQKGETKAARGYYQAAIDAGWPRETVHFAQERR